ncbi:MAG: hypothetical protein JWM35_19, partial [Verrucomicrobia bacterium]|nr:hypothetical protein [Verrucomicrobiota bacterium]
AQCDPLCDENNPAVTGGNRPG